jgi:hypothetical protein
MHEASGTATLQLPDGTTKDVALARENPAAGEPAVYFCPMHASVVRSEPGVCELCGGMKLYTQDRLAGAVDLPKVPAQGIDASFRIGDPKSPITLTQKLGAAAAPPRGEAPAEGVAPSTAPAKKDIAPAGKDPAATKKDVAPKAP